MDVAKMVKLAQCWTGTLPEALKSVIESPKDLDLLVQPNTTARTTLTFNSSSPSPKIRFLEHVQIRFSALLARRGDMDLVLVSPAGTRSKVIIGEL